MGLLDDGVNVLGGGEPAKASGDGGFDPADHTVDEVKDHVRSNPGEAEAVLESEESGEGRVTLVSWLRSQIDDEG
jgi:hypothetical protein